MYEHIAIMFANLMWTVCKVNGGKNFSLKPEAFIPKYIMPEESELDESDPMQYFLQYCKNNKDVFKNG